LFYGDCNSYGGAAERVGNAADARAKIRVRKRPRREEVVISAYAGVVPFLVVTSKIRVHENGEGADGLKIRMAQPEPAETVSGRRRYTLARPSTVFKGHCIAGRGVGTA